MTPAERAPRVLIPCLRLLYTKPNGGKPESWRGVVSTRALSAKSQSPAANAKTDPPAETLYHHRALLVPGNLEVPIDRDSQVLVSLTPELARAVKPVLTDPQYVIQKGYYYLRAEPVVSDFIEIGRQLVWTRKPGRDLELEMAVSVRGLLGEKAKTIDETMPHMWNNLQYLVALLPERLEGPIGYYYGKAPVAIRTNDVRLPQGEDLVAGTDFISAHGNSQTLLRLLGPARNLIEFLWQTTPEETQAAVPTDIVLEEEEKL